MKITKPMVALLSHYSIALTRATTKGRLIDLKLGWMNEIYTLYHGGLITLEQFSSMDDYFSSLIQKEEARIENDK